MVAYHLTSHQHLSLFYLRRREMDLAVKRLLLEQDGQAGGLKLYYDLVNKYSFHLEGVVE